ncbi:hypothetical protein ACWA7J_21685 [Leptothrix sp. BB-4]
MTQANRPGVSPIKPAALGDLAGLLASPQIATLLAAEQRRKDEAEVAARSDCLARVRVARLAEDEASGPVEKALAELRALESKVEEKRRQVSEASNARAVLVSARSAIEQELLRQHSEGLIQHALFRLQQLRADLEQRLANLESNKWVNNTLPSGFVISRKENPEVLPKIAARRSQLDFVAAAVDEISKMVEAELVPAEARERIAYLLKESGLERPEQSENDTQ